MKIVVCRHRHTYDIRPFNSWNGILMKTNGKKRFGFFPSGRKLRRKHTKTTVKSLPLFELYGNEHTLQTFTQFSLIQQFRAVLWMRPSEFIRPFRMLYALRRLLMSHCNAGLFFFWLLLLLFFCYVSDASVKSGFGDVTWALTTIVITSIPRYNNT